MPVIPRFVVQNILGCKGEIPFAKKENKATKKSDTMILLYFKYLY